MPRTIINLASDDKAWLDAEAKRRGQSITSLVSEAVAEYRVRQLSAQSQGYSNPSQPQQACGNKETVSFGRTS